MPTILSRFISLLSSSTLSSSSFLLVEKVISDKRKCEITRASNGRPLTRMFPVISGEHRFRWPFVNAPIRWKRGNDIDVAIETGQCIVGTLVVRVSFPRPTIPTAAFCASLLLPASGHIVLSSSRRMSSEVHLSTAKWISSRWKLSSARTRLIGITSILEVIFRVDGRRVRFHAYRVPQRDRFVP